MTAHHTAALTRALQSPYTLASFRTLDKHRAAGRFDRSAALRLLQNNARDATRHTPTEVRDRLALALLAVWSGGMRLEARQADDGRGPYRWRPVVLHGSQLALGGIYDTPDKLAWCDYDAVAIMLADKRHEVRIAV